MSIGGPGQPPKTRHPDTQPGQPDSPGRISIQSPYSPQIPQGSGYPQTAPPLGARTAGIVAYPTPRLAAPQPPPGLPQTYGTMDKLSGLASYWNGLGTVINNFGSIQAGQAPSPAIPVGYAQGGALLPAPSWPVPALGAFTPVVLHQAQVAIQQQLAMLYGQMSQTLAAMQALCAQYAAQAIPLPAFQPTPMAIPITTAFQHIHAFGTSALPAPMQAYPCQGYPSWGALQGQYFLMPPMPACYGNAQWLGQQAMAPASPAFLHGYQGFNSADNTYGQADENPAVDETAYEEGADEDSLTVDDELHAQNSDEIQPQTLSPKVKQQLLQACLNNDLDTLKQLFEQGAVQDANSPIRLSSNHEATPLMLTAMQGNSAMPMVDYLVAQGADPNLSCVGLTPMSMACASKHEADQMIRHLLDNGAQLNAENYGDYFKQALKHQGEKSLRVLLKAVDNPRQLLAETGLSPDILDGYSAELKNLLTAEPDRISEQAHQDHEAFMAACECFFENQIAPALTRLKQAWPTFDINTPYDDQGAALLRVCASVSQTEEIFRRKLKTIYQLKQAGAIFDPSQRSTCEALIPETDPGQRQLLFKMLTAPTGRELLKKIEDNAEKYKEYNVLDDSMDTPVTQQEETDSPAERAAWDKQEYRITPRDRLDGEQQERLKDQQEHLLQAQWQDEQAHTARDRDFLARAAHADLPPPLVPPAPASGRGSRSSATIPAWKAGIAIRPSSNASIGKTADGYSEAHFNIDNTSHELSILVDPHGPGSTKLAAIIASQLPAIVEKEITRTNHQEKPISEALKIAMVKMDRILANSPDVSDTTGADLNMVLKINSSPNPEYWSVNLGDSATLAISADGSARQLSLPTAENHSLGDHILAEGKSARPRVFRIDLSGQEARHVTFIQCSRAVREQVGPQGMAALASQIQSEGSQPVTAQQLSETLVNLAASQAAPPKGNLIAVVKPLSESAPMASLPAPIQTPASVEARLKQMPLIPPSGNEGVDALFQQIQSQQPASSDNLEALYVQLHTPRYAELAVPKELEQWVKSNNDTLYRLAQCTDADPTKRLKQLEQLQQNVASAPGHSAVQRLYQLKKADTAAAMLANSSHWQTGLEVLFSLKDQGESLLQDEALNPQVRPFLKSLMRSYGWLHQCYRKSQEENENVYLEPVARNSQTASDQSAGLNGQSDGEARNFATLAKADLLSLNRPNPAIAPPAEQDTVRHQLLCLLLQKSE